MWYVSVWLISRNIMSLRFIHIVVNGRISLLWLNHKFFFFFFLIFLPCMSIRLKSIYSRIIIDKRKRRLFSQFSNTLSTIILHNNKHTLYNHNNISTLFSWFFRHLKCFTSLELVFLGTFCIYLFKKLIYLF